MNKKELCVNVRLEIVIEPAKEFGCGIGIHGYWTARRDLEAYGETEEEVMQKLERKIQSYMCAFIAEAASNAILHEDKFYRG